VFRDAGRGRRAAPYLTGPRPVERRSFRRAEEHRQLQRSHRSHPIVGGRIPSGVPLHGHGLVAESLEDHHPHRRRPPPPRRISVLEVVGDDPPLESPRRAPRRSPSRKTTPPPRGRDHSPRTTRAGWITAEALRYHRRREDEASPTEKAWSARASGAQRQRTGGERTATGERGPDRRHERLTGFRCRGAEDVAVRS